MFSSSWSARIKSGTGEITPTWNGNTVPRSELKDVSWREEQEKRFRKFQQASARLLVAINELRKAARDIEDNDGSCLWIDKGGAAR
jgi:hypothetical protein